MHLSSGLQVSLINLMVTKPQITRTQNQKRLRTLIEAFTLVCALFFISLNLKKKKNTLHPIIKIFCCGGAQTTYKPPINTPWYLCGVGTAHDTLSRLRNVCFQAKKGGPALERQRCRPKSLCGGSLAHTPALPLTLAQFLLREAISVQQKDRQPWCLS